MTRHKILLFALLLTSSTHNVSASDETLTCDLKSKLIHVIPNRIPIEEMYEILQTASEAKFCTVVLGFRGGIPFSDSSVIDRDYIREVKRYADDLNLNLVPEVQFLTHQEHLFKISIPDEMYNLTTYNPESQIVKAMVAKVVNELVELLDPVAFHVGHDEVAGINNYSRKRFMRIGEEILPAELFLESVSFLHGLLDGLDIETWMWGDMLISQSEAPEMLFKNFHGDLPGYGLSLRKKIPKGVVIFDWHYHDTGSIFSSIDVFRNSGFEVVGVTYRNRKNIGNFTEYAAANGASGMMNTLWDVAPTPNFAELKNRIKYSGLIFSRFF